jgi:hypothetical protein
MFESAEPKHTLPDQNYDAEVPGLRAVLLDAQFDLLAKQDRLLLIIVGEASRGGDSINRLSSWLAALAKPFNHVGLFTGE